MRVSGTSMLPTLRPGDIVLVRPSVQFPPAIGGLVVFRSERWGSMPCIKRVGSHGANSFAVSSDNPMDGTDSRQRGSLGPEELLGLATVRMGRYWLPVPLGRKRRPR